MDKLVIKNFCGIESCQVDFDNLLVLNGDGKEIVAKAIYYFEMVGKEAIDLSIKIVARRQQGCVDFFDELINDMSEKFYSVFGDCKFFKDTYLEYNYCTDTFIKVFMNSKTGKFYIDMSRNITELFSIWNMYFCGVSIDTINGAVKRYEKRIDCVLGDSCDVCYIPEGRGSVSVLCREIVWVYSCLSDIQKSHIDLCTREFIETVLKIRSYFSEGILGIASMASFHGYFERDVVSDAVKLYKKVLGGLYKCSNGYDVIEYEDGSSCTLNYAKSAQREVVWVVNMIFYYMLRKKKAMFIIEDAEAYLDHVGKDALKSLIRLARDCGNTVVLSGFSSLDSDFVLAEV